MDLPLPRGKLPADDLARFLTGLPADPSVVLGPAPGEDAAVLAFPTGELLIAAADPITFPTPRPGWYVVHVNANDIATRGGTPRWFLATLMLPASATSAAATRILDDVAAACAEVGAVLVGGHTEISDAVRLPVVSGCMLGTVAPERLLRTGGGKPGDALVVAGFLGVEGTSVLAGAAAERLHQAGWDDAALAAAAGLVDRLGISVLPAARLAAPHAHAMHDLTEGGLATAVRELATASGTGAVLRADAAPLRRATAALCKALSIDPLGLLSSGSLLIALPPDEVASLRQQLADDGIASAACGELTADREQLLELDGGCRPLPSFERDELARWLDERDWEG